MTVAADTSKHPVVLALWALVTLAMGGVVFYFFGALAAAAVVVLAASPVAVRDGRTAAPRCMPCNRQVEAHGLQPPERAATASYRRRSYLVAGLLFLTAVALGAPGVAAAPEFYVESFGVGWRARLPATHREVERLVLTMSGDGGPVRLVARRAENPRASVKTFLIMLARLREKDARPIEDASYDRWIKKALETTVGGAPSIEKSRIVMPRLGTGRETTFEATVEGKPVRGRLRAFANERNLVMLAFVAAGEDGAENSVGLTFLDSVEAVTATMERDELGAASAAPVASKK